MVNIPVDFVNQKDIKLQKRKWKVCKIIVTLCAFSVSCYYVREYFKIIIMYFLTINLEHKSDSYATLLGCELMNNGCS